MCADSVSLQNSLNALVELKFYSRFPMQSCGVCRYQNKPLYRCRCCTMDIFIRISFTQWHTQFNRIFAPEKLNSAYATPFSRFGLCVAALWCCLAFCWCACVYVYLVLIHVACPYALVTWAWAWQGWFCGVGVHSVDLKLLYLCECSDKNWVIDSAALSSCHSKYQVAKSVWAKRSTK